MLQSYSPLDLFFFARRRMIRRDALEKIGGFDETLRYFHEDYELALRIALEGPWALISDPLDYMESIRGKMIQKSAGGRNRNERMRNKDAARYPSEIEGKKDSEKLKKYVQRLGRNYRELWISRLARKEFPGASNTSLVFLKG